MGVSNSQVAHIWAHQNRDCVDSNNGNFYARGRLLYSYGSHFVVGVALGDCYASGHVITADSYSISTAKHINEAERATGYDAPNLPGLTAIADSIVAVTSGRGRYINADAARSKLRTYLEDNAPELGADALALLLSWTGSKADPVKLQERAQAKREREKEARAKAEAQAHADKASELAKLPWRTIRDRLLSGAGQWNWSPNYALDAAIKETYHAHRNARGVRIKAAVWSHLKRLRALKEAGTFTRIQDKAKALEGVAALRRIAAGDYGGPATAKRAGRFAWTVGARTLADKTRAVLEGAHMPPATRQNLERQERSAQAWADRIKERQEREERRRNARRNARQDLDSLCQVTRRAALCMAGDAQGHAWPFVGPYDESARYGRVAIKCRSLARSLGDLGRFPRIAERLEERAQVWEAIAQEAEARDLERRERERAEAERIRNLPRPERLDLWRAGRIESRQLCPGDSGLSFPLLRATGAVLDGCQVKAGTLETSEGATAPLRHAFRIFLAAKLVRESGTPWTSGTRSHGLPATLRAGHFSLDVIHASGGFKAGCHAITWEEVERLARDLGLFDCEAAPETVSQAEAV